MTRVTRAALAAIVVVGVLLALAAAAAFIIPRAAGMERWRTDVARRIGESVGGSAKVGGLRLSWLPTPHVVLRDVEVATPQHLRATIPVLAVYPRLQPLLHRQLDIAVVDVAGAEVHIGLVKPAEPGTKPPADVRQAVASALGAVAAVAASRQHPLAVVIDAASVHVTGGDFPDLAATALDGRAELTGNLLTVDLTCASNLWKRLALHAAADVAAAKGSAHLALSRLRPELLSAGFLPAGWQLDPAAVDLDVQLSADGLDTAQAVAQASVPALTVRRGGESLALAGASLQLTAQRDEKATTLALTALRVESPPVQLTGKAWLSRDPAADHPAATLELEATDFDVAWVRSLVKLLAVESPVVRRTLDVLVDGKAGRLALHTRGDTVADLWTGETVAVEASAWRATARAPGFAAPLQVEGAQLAYDGRAITVQQARLTLGRSTLSDVSGGVDLQKTPPELEASSGSSSISLDEIFPWAAAQGLLANRKWAPTSLTGTVAINSLQLRGPVNDPAAWHVDLAGSVRDLVFDSPLQQRLAVKGPLSIAAMRFLRSEASTSFAGTITAAHGLSGAVDLTVRRDAIEIKRLDIKDADSDVRLSLLIAPKVIGLTFAGHVTAATLDALAPETHVLGDRIQGDFQARLVTDQPLRSTAAGSLEITDLLLSPPGAPRLNAQRLSVRAENGLYSIDGQLEAAAHDDFHVQGTLRPVAGSVVADLDVSAGHVSWENIVPFLPSSASASPGASPGAAAPAAAAPPVAAAPPAAVDDPWPPVVRGRAHVTAESFSMGGFTWQAVEGSLRQDPSGLKVTVTQANLCGIASPGSIAVAAGALRLAFTPRAVNQDLRATVACLFGHTGSFSGHYRCGGSVTAQGEPAALAQSLRGNLELHAGRGQIDNVGMMGKVLSVVGMAGGSVGSFSEMSKNGLGYDHADVKGDLEGETLRITEAVVDGPSAKIAGQGSINVVKGTLDVTLLVAPLKKIDTVVGHIPVLGTILGGNLITIPIKVTGSLNNPEVIPLDPSAVGSGLLRVMERTIKLPVTLIQPLLPSSEKWW